MRNFLESQNNHTSRMYMHLMLCLSSAAVVPSPARQRWPLPWASPRIARGRLVHGPRSATTVAQRSCGDLAVSSEPRFASMQCPVCHEIRYSRWWKPSQWQAYSPRTVNYNCCALCAPGNWRPEEGFGREHWTREIARLEGTMLCAGRVLRFEQFFRSWLDLPKTDRKAWSYCGGLRTRSSEAAELIFRPCVEYRVEDYFDPGNDIYAYAFKSLWPRVASENGLGVVSIGDIFESVLGFQWIHHARTSEGWLSVAQWIDAYVYAVYRHICCLDVYPSEFIAWRRQLPQSMNGHVILN